MNKSPNEFIANLRKEGDREFIEVKGSLWTYPREYNLTPFHCSKCLTPLFQNEKECANCQDWKKLDGAVAMGLYWSKEKLKQNSTSEDIIQSEKKSRYSQALGIALSEYVRKKQPELMDFDIVVPVPGENKERTIAQMVSKELKIELRTDLLKYHETSKQMKDTPRDRKSEEDRRNFRATGMKIPGKSVLLIDDILTNGSTADQCASELKLSGANRVVAGIIGRDVYIPQEVDGRIVEGYIDRSVPTKYDDQMVITLAQSKPYLIHCIDCGKILRPLKKKTFYFNGKIVPNMVDVLVCDNCNREIRSEAISIRVRPAPDSNAYHLFCPKHYSPLLLNGTKLECNKECSIFVLTISLRPV